jgi:spore germination protein
MGQEKNDPALTPFQFFSLLFGGMLGFGSLNISRFATVAVGRDGWISVLLGGIIVMINTLVFIGLSKRFPEKTIIQYSKIILGKFLGGAIGLLFVISAIFIAGLTLAITAFIINSWILTFTPPYIIYITMLLVSLYVCIKDLKILGRVSVILFFLHIIFFFLFIPPVTQMGNLKNLFPIGKSGWINILKGIPSILYCFAGYELISIFYPYAQEKKKSAKVGLLSISILVMIYTFAVITQIITFPLDYLKKAWVPSVNFISIISVPFLERLDIIFISSWIYVFFKVISSFYYAATLEIQQIFNVKNRKFICVLIAPLIFSIAFFSGTINQIDRFTFVATSYTLGLSLTVPIILLGLSFLFKKGGGPNA